MKITVGRATAIFAWLFMLGVPVHQAVAGQPVFALQQDLPTLVKKNAPAVVVIVVLDDQNMAISVGSGVITQSYGEILSCFHVLQGGHTAIAKLPDGRLFEIKGVSSWNKDEDWVIARIEGEDLPVARRGKSSSVKPGESIFVLGAPLGFLESTVSEGVVSAIRRGGSADGSAGLIQISAPISEGSSGGPVFNMRGEVIGLATSSLIKGQNLNFAVPIDRVIAKPSGTALTPIHRLDLPDIDPSTEAGRVMAGIALYQLDRYREALPHLQAAFEASPKNEDLGIYLGLTYGELGRYSEATETFKSVIKLNPENAEAHGHLGSSYGLMGKHREAVIALKESLVLNKHNARTHSNLGIAYSYLGDNDAAMAAFKESLIHKPEFAEAHDGVGNCHVRRGEYREAIVAYANAIRYGLEGANIHVKLGMMYAATGDHAEGVAALKKAIEVDPKFASAYYNLGVTYVEMGNRQEALRQYKLLEPLDKKLAQQLFDLIYPRLANLHW